MEAYTRVFTSQGSGIRHIGWRLVLILTMLVASNTLIPVAVCAQPAQHKYGFFEENKGQFAEEVRYVARMPHVDIWITNNGLVYDVFRLDTDEKAIAEKRTRFGVEYETHRPDEPEPQLRSGQAIFVSYKDGTAAPAFEAHKPVSGVFNYLSGGDSTGDVTGVERFSELYVRNVYPGIDARYYFDRGGFRYDFIVHPGADPAQIRMVYDGAVVFLNTNGELEFESVAGTLKHGDLKTFSGKGRNKRSVSSVFRVSDNEVDFAVGGYDSDQTLVIDPLVFGTYFGSAGSDNVSGLHVYENGESLILGHAASHGAGIPTTPGVYMETNPVNGHFLSRFASDGTGLVFSTYFGPKERCSSGWMELAVKGNIIFVSELTSCVDAANAGSFDTSFNGVDDILLSKFDEWGSQRLWATYLGGGRTEWVLDMLVDENGDLVISGITNSTDFPTTPGAYREQDYGIQSNTNWEGFVSKLSGSGDEILFSTYLGFENSGTDVLIEEMSSGDLVVVSATGETLTLSPTAFDIDHEDSLELVVMVMTPDGKEILYMSYLGGHKSEIPTCLLRSATGEIWIAGETWSPGFPLTHTSDGATLTRESGTDIFVVKMTEKADHLLQGTRFGSPSYRASFTNCTLLNNEEVVVVGAALNDFPVTSDGMFLRPEIGGAFISVVSADGTDVRYSTILGGNGGVRADFVRAYESTMVVAGYTTSTDLPTTPGAVNSTMTFDGEFGDIFLIKFCFPEIVTREPQTRESTLHSDVTVYPNPASEKIVVELVITRPTEYTIEVFSLLGQSMTTIAGRAPIGLIRIPIDIQGFPTGMYLVRSAVGTLSFDSRRFIVAH